MAADPHFAATILANEGQGTGIEFKELKNEGQTIPTLRKTIAKEIYHQSRRPTKKHGVLIYSVFFVSWGAWIIAGRNAILASNFAI
jgi:hypothetical protein